MRNLFIIFNTQFNIKLFNLVTNAICDKSPEKSVTTQPKQSGNGGFAIGIVGSPQFYRPGQQYEITLEVKPISSLKPAMYFSIKLS